MKFIISCFKKHLQLVLFLLLYFSILSYKLIFHHVPFYDWDESIYLQAGKEMIQNSYFLSPMWQGTVWLDKPPLGPLVYGLVAKMFFPVIPEISTRIFTLLIAVIVLVFVYILYFRIIKERFIAVGITALTAFMPIFIQRAQVVNLDVFLLLGWLGYFIFYKNFFLGLFFLATGVFSKSLLGFYPALIIIAYEIYFFYVKKINKKDLFNQLKKSTAHILILSLWFLMMLVIFGKDFWQLHIIESHFRRVSASIEFHFGQRTFYIDLVKEQLRSFFWPSIVGLLLILYQILKDKKNNLIYALSILPWFIFLNLTKTKIFWYFYTTIPQFSFLSLYPLLLIRNKKYIYYFLLLAACASIFYTGIKNDKLFSTYYSKNEDNHYQLSLYAKEKCRSLSVLLNQDSRNSFATLEKMGLLITTTKWWGNHPSIIYYFGKKVTFLYDADNFKKQTLIAQKRDCFVKYSNDLEINIDNSFHFEKKFGELNLYQKN